MITGHVWRPTPTNGLPGSAANRSRCGYANCGRPRAEHARAVSNDRYWSVSR